MVGRKSRVAPDARFGLTKAQLKRLQNRPTIPRGRELSDEALLEKLRSFNVGRYQPRSISEVDNSALVGGVNM